MKRELLRDLPALGSWLMYALVIARAAIEPYRTFLAQMVGAGLLLLVCQQRFRFDGYTARVIVMTVFTSIFYRDIPFGAFALAVCLGVIYASSTMHPKPRIARGGRCWRYRCADSLHCCAGSDEVMRTPGGDSDGGIPIPPATAKHPSPVHVHPVALVPTRNHPPCPFRVRVPRARERRGINGREQWRLNLDQARAVGRFVRETEYAVPRESAGSRAIQDRRVFVRPAQPPAPSGATTHGSVRMPCWGRSL